MPEQPDEHDTPKPEVISSADAASAAGQSAGFDPTDLLGGLGLGGAPGGMGGGALGGFDLGGLLDMAGQMQQHIAEAQEQAAATVLEGVAGGGVVKVTVTGGGDFQSVTIDPEVIDPSDVEMLQDLVLAALNDAMAQVHELQAGAFGDPSAPGGFDLGGLLGGLG